MTHLRVLVVEDELTIALSIKLFLESANCEVIGPSGRLDAALEIAASSEIDVALLDVNLRGLEVFPVADILARRNVPLIFLSGYEDAVLPSRFQGCRTLRKPARPEAILSALDAVTEVNA